MNKLALGIIGGPNVAALAVCAYSCLADDRRGLVVEAARREHHEGMDLSHFAADLKVAIDPDDVPAIWDPWPAGDMP